MRRFSLSPEGDESFTDLHAMQAAAAMVEDTPPQLGARRRRPSKELRHAPKLDLMSPFPQGGRRKSLAGDGRTAFEGRRKSVSEEHDGKGGRKKSISEEVRFAPDVPDSPSGKGSGSLPSKKAMARRRLSLPATIAAEQMEELAGMTAGSPTPVAPLMAPMLLGRKSLLSDLPTIMDNSPCNSARSSLESPSSYLSRGSSWLADSHNGTPTRMSPAEPSSPNDPFYGESPEYQQPPKIPKSRPVGISFHAESSSESEDDAIRVKVPYKEEEFSMFGGDDIAQKIREASRPHIQVRERESVINDVRTPSGLKGMENFAPPSPVNIVVAPAMLSRQGIVLERGTRDIVVVNENAAAALGHPKVIGVTPIHHEKTDKAVKTLQAQREEAKIALKERIRMNLVGRSAKIPTIEDQAGSPSPPHSRAVSPSPSPTDSPHRSPSPSRTQSPFASRQNTMRSLLSNETEQRPRSAATSGLGLSPLGNMSPGSSRPHTSVGLSREGSVVGKGGEGGSLERKLLDGEDKRRRAAQERLEMLRKKQEEESQKKGKKKKGRRKRRPANLPWSSSESEPSDDEETKKLKEFRRRTQAYRSNIDRLPEPPSEFNPAPGHYHPTYHFVESAAPKWTFSKAPKKTLEVVKTAAPTDDGVNLGDAEAFGFAKETQEFLHSEGQGSGLADFKESDDDASESDYSDEADDDISAGSYEQQQIEIAGNQEALKKQREAEAAPQYAVFKSTLPARVPLGPRPESPDKVYDVESGLEVLSRPHSPEFKFEDVPGRKPLGSVASMQQYHPKYDAIDLKPSCGVSMARLPGREKKAYGYAAATLSRPSTSQNRIIPDDVIRPRSRGGLSFSQQISRSERLRCPVNTKSAAPRKEVLPSRYEKMKMEQILAKKIFMEENEVGKEWRSAKVRGFHQQAGRDIGRSIYRMYQSQLDKRPVFRVDAPPPRGSRKQPPAVLLGLSKVKNVRQSLRTSRHPPSTST